MLGIETMGRDDGKPLVARMHYLRRMGVDSVGKKIEEEPNWDILKNAS